MHTAAQLFNVLTPQRALHAHRIFALDLIARMHQPVGELARVGEKQKPGAVDIKAPYGDPAARRQTRKTSRPPARVFARHELTDRLVVDEKARFGGRLQPHAPSIDRDLVLDAGACAERRNLAAHGDAAGGNPGFDFTARAEAGARQKLLPALSL